MKLDLVLDTSFLVASKLAKDRHHAASRKIKDRIRDGEWDHLILSDHVLSETLTVIQARSGHGDAVQFANEILESAQITFLVAGDDLFDALRVFESEQQGGLSLVDCLLIQIARSYRAQIATFDRGFEGIRGVELVGPPKKKD